MFYERVDSSSATKEGSLSGDLVRLLPGIGKLLDSACLLASGFITYYSQIYYSYKTADTYNVAIVTVWLLTVVLFSVGGLYSLQALGVAQRNLGTIAIGVATSFLLLLAAAFSLKISEDVSRLWVFTFFLASIASLFMIRLSLAYVLSRMEARQILAQKIVYFGEKAYVERLRSHVENAESRFLNVQSVIAEDFVKADASIDGEKLDERLAALVQYIRTVPVDDVIVAFPWSAAAEISKVVDKLRELPVNVYLGSDIAGLEFPLRPARDALRGTVVYEVIGRPLSGWDLIWKSAEDFLLASFLIVVLAPLLLLIACLIKSDSPGPAIFKQKRYGFNNEVFDIYKFRTMRVEENAAGTTRQAIPGDKRVTRVGAFLRRTSLDELPQLLNVLGGSMSVVGPRPHAVDHNEEYARSIRGYFARHRVKPGITGLAQVKGFRGVTDTLEKMQSRVKYDVMYTENHSLLLDLKILAKTVIVCVGGRNAY